MDMNHQFLHRKQMGQITPRYLGRRVGEDWLEIDYSFARTGGKQPLGEAAILGSRRGTGTNVHKRPDDDPHRVSLPNTADLDRAATSRSCISGFATRRWMPQQRINRTFGLLSVRRPKIPGLLDAAWPLLVWFTERIFREDREIVEMEQAAHDAPGARTGTRRFSRPSATCAPCWPPMACTISSAAETAGAIPPAMRPVARR